MLKGFFDLPNGYNRKSLEHSKSGTVFAISRYGQSCVPLVRVLNSPNCITTNTIDIKLGRHPMRVKVSHFTYYIIVVRKFIQANNKETIEVLNYMSFALWIHHSHRTKGMQKSCKRVSSWRHHVDTFLDSPFSTRFTSILASLTMRTE